MPRAVISERADVVQGVVNKNAGERTETVRDTVPRNKVDMEQFGSGRHA
ncbi:MAG: hypothetical protein ACR2H4_07440 [Pyrinomonadaceae bacterium]